MIPFDEKMFEKLKEDVPPSGDWSIKHEILHVHTRINALGKQEPSPSNSAMIIALNTRLDELHHQLALASSLNSCSSYQ